VRLFHYLSPLKKYEDAIKSIGFCIRFTVVTSVGEITRREQRLQALVDAHLRGEYVSHREFSNEVSTN
jgi:hypothetical protein